MPVCERCGATLGDPDMHGNYVCQSCGRVRFPDDDVSTTTATGSDEIGSDEIGAPPAGQSATSSGIVFPGTPGVPSNTLRTSSNVGTAKFAGLGCFFSIFIAVVVLIAGVAVFVFSSAQDVLDQAGTFSGTSDRDIVADSMLALPGEPAGSASFVALTRRYDQRAAASVTELVRLDEGEDDPVWVSPALGESVSSVPLVTDGAMVFTVAERRLMALDADHGTIMWQQALPDNYPPACTQCLFALSGRVIVQTIDGTLQGFDAINGAVAWQRRLEDTSAPVRDVGSGLAVIDRGELGQRVVILDPASGAERLTFVPECLREGGFSGSGIDSSTIIVPSPSESALYLGFGLSPACWQSWDTASGQLIWSTTFDGGYLTTSFGGTASVAGNRLVFASQDIVGALDTGTGTFVPFAGGPDFEVYPIGTDGAIAAFWAKNTRGTASYEVWGFDTATGERRWAHAVGEVVPSAVAPTTIVSTNETIVLSAVEGRAVRLVSISGDDPHDIFSTVIDLATGSAREAGGFSMPAEIGVFTVEEAPWRGPVAVFSADDRLLLVDTDTGELRWTWPS